jgi:hypothetical protein
VEEQVAAGRPLRRAQAMGDEALIRMQQRDYKLLLRWFREGSV